MNPKEKADRENHDEPGGKGRQGRIIMVPEKEAEMGRIILFTGKGGVGKTSVAAAHAVRSAGEGRSTLLVSADMAHNLGDLFQLETGGEVVKAGEGLFLLELDPYRLMRREFPHAVQALSDLLSVPDLSARPMPLPGFDTLFSLLMIGKIYREGTYDRILVDCAPTGETLSLLKFPELLSWYMEKFFPVGKVITRILAPAAQARYRVKLPERKAMNEIERLHGQLAALQELLRDSGVCTVRLVCTPERMAVEETKRAFMRLNLYGYQTDGLYINRLLPDMEDNPFLSHWRELQQQYVRELEEVFAGYPIVRLPWYPQEVRGSAAVERMGGALPEDELFGVRVRTESEVYTPIEGGFRLQLRLPEASGEVRAVCQGMDLYIEADGAARRIPLPDSLKGASAAVPVLEDGMLYIDLRQRKDGEP